MKDSGRIRLEIPRSVPEATLLLVLTGAAISFSMASPFLPLFFHDILSLTPSTIQLLGSIQALGQTAFAILLGRAADKRSRGQAIAIGLIISATSLAGIIITKNLLFALPLIFFFGSARASSYVAFSILSTIRSGGTRGGQYGFYLTLEDIGFVIGSYLGGSLYSIDPMTSFTVVIVSLVLLALPATVTSFTINKSLEPASKDGLVHGVVPKRGCEELKPDEGPWGTQPLKNRVPSEEFIMPISDNRYWNSHVGTQTMGGNATRMAQTLDYLYSE